MNERHGEPPVSRDSEESRRHTAWTAARWAAIVLFAAAQIFLGRDDTPVADEARHVRDGAAAWDFGRIDVNPEHPPFVKLASAAMLPAAERRAALAPAPGDPIEVDARFAVST